jgi:hypothetical protein
VSHGGVLSHIHHVAFDVVHSQELGYHAMDSHQSIRFCLGHHVSLEQLHVLRETS